MSSLRAGSMIWLPNKVDGPTWWRDISGWSEVVFAPFLCLSSAFYLLYFFNCFDSSQHFWLHCHRFTHCPLETHFLTLQVFFWNLGGNLWVHNFCITHTCKTSTIWMMVTSDVSLSKSRFPWEHSWRDFWVTVEWIPGTNSLCGSSFSSSSSWGSVLKAKSFKGVYLHTYICLN